ncbi:MAG: hypothetical protein AB1346_03635 [Thermodesulfobacteriota bacterium]
MMRRCGIALALFLLAPAAWAGSGVESPARLCDQADRAERDAGDAERKSVERKRFLAGKGGSAAFPGTAANAGMSAAAAQSIRAQVAQARALLPQIRKGIAAAEQDRGVVPGLSQYFAQAESSIGSAIQAVESCLAAPDRCSPPAIHCPVPPNIAVFNRNVMDADFIRKIQDSYRQAANEAHQACRNLQTGAMRELDRMKQESRNAAALAAGSSGAGAGSFGDVDLYLRRAESLRGEAARSRLEADRISGVAGYCRSPGRAMAAGTGGNRTWSDALRDADRKKKADAGLRPDAKVADLKEEWERKWNGGPILDASDVPLPKVDAKDAEEDGRTLLEVARDYGSYAVVQRWNDAKAAYREGNEQMELTEFLLSRPVELAKDVAWELVENNLGSFGKSLKTGYTILNAVKETGDEVGEILGDAPRVIVHGSAADAKELSQRADRVPYKFLNDLFDDVTGKFPPPRIEYKYKQALGDDRG